MSEIIKLNSIKDYNDLLNSKTIHPLVSVVDLSKTGLLRNSRKYLGFYVVFLKDIKCSDRLKYGRRYYDFQENTLLFAAPGQIIGNDDNGEEFQPKGWCLTFHPDLLYGTSLGKNIQSYTFFSYAVNEALHISLQERQIIMGCLMNIDNEIKNTKDKHSNHIITSSIELLLNYCVRFYERQFVTRKEENKDILNAFEKLLNNYFISDKPYEIGTPTVSYCAEELNLSANYFGDLIKKETGYSAKDYIIEKTIRIAKERLVDPSFSVSDVAYSLGFQYPQYFSKVFRKIVGFSPNEYKDACNEVI